MAKDLVLKKICKECGKVNSVKAEVCTNKTCGVFFSDDNIELRNVDPQLNWINETQGKLKETVKVTDLKPNPSINQRAQGYLCPDPKCGYFNVVLEGEKKLLCDACYVNLKQIKMTKEPSYHRLELTWMTSAQDANTLLIDLSDGKPFVFGREQATDEVILKNEYISRKHLKFTCQDGDIYIEDLSVYGTWLNNEKLPKNQPTRVSNRRKLKLKLYSFEVNLKLYAD
jgi:hypothetical protein